jgi:DNA invertase Pin-like site-specific DNA recombinase
LRERTIIAAIYVPVSTGDGEQNKQMSRLRQIAFREGWKVLVFLEREPRAGTRPVFREMMDRSRRSKFQVLLVESLDCLARSLADLYESLIGLHRLEIRVMAVSDGLDLNPRNGAGQNFLNSFTLLAETERRMMVRNVRAGVARAQRLGVHCGRPRRKYPLAQVRKLLEEGLSIRAIAARLEVPRSSLAAALKAADSKRVPAPAKEM